MSGPISIIESRWWKKGNHSVRALFEAVGAIHYDNPSTFFYDMFVDRTSLWQIIKSRASDGVTEIVYLATHGNQNSVGPTEDTSISRTELRNDFIAANQEGQIKGLFLGTCLTGNMNMAHFLLTRQSNLDWLAGYREPVDWVDGSAIDMVFFHKLTIEYKKNVSRRRGKWDAKAMAHEAATQLVKLIPGAHTQYGFNIYFRDGDNIKGMFA